MLNCVAQGIEPIPGYTLIERIGAGAYGEVWRAEAPGGLVKAVKVVYGYHNESRAVRELKALQRVKQLRHPFLLSLERFEVSDGRLIIVTELADGSLKDRFHQCRAAGAPGIPREEMLRHMRDAADALDFLMDSESLQHLDVKGENLLLVGGRLKLADFGLVQNVAKSEGSALDGMTPRYAAPEVFKGQPTKQSDQFSLAVVYAELVTGAPPFDARSPSECAVQHLVGTKPKLAALPAHDQPLVARALSRRPEDRFPSCRAFVECLVAATGASAPDAGRQGAGPLADLGATRGGQAAETSASNGTTRASRAPESTSLGPIAPARTAPSPGVAPRGAARNGQEPPPLGDDATLIFSQDPAPLQPDAAFRRPTAARRLSSVEIEPAPWQGRPTLLIGVGGLAAQTLARLQCRLAGRGLPIDQVPAWKIMLLDTDRQTLEATRAAGVSAESVESLLLPIRTTQEYRESSSRALKWLSRRWLYNIPRIPRTSGWRPLGRLALVDHGPGVVNRLREAIAQFTRAEALESSSAAAQAKFAGPPLIMLVASISGGTGSGMVLDLAYVVRKLANELGIGSFTLRGMLLHATESDRDAQDLARANAFACLTELAHYNRPGGGYPGEAGLDVPAFPSIVPTFDETIVAHLGDELSAIDFQEQIESVSDQLFHTLATWPGAVADKLRTSDEAGAESRGELNVGTFGLSAVNNLRRDEFQQFVDRVCQLTAEKWLGPSEASHSPPAPTHIAPRTSDFDTGAYAKYLVKRALGDDASAALVRELSEAIEARIDRADEELREGKRDAEAAGELTLAAINAELCALAAALAAMRDAGQPAQADAQSPRPKSPLGSIRATVCSFLNEQILEIAQDLARDFPRAFVRQQRAPSGETRCVESASSARQPFDGFCAQLRERAQVEINLALQQVDVSRLLIEIAGKSRAAVEPIRELLSKAVPRLSASRATERLFVFAPGKVSRGVLERFFNQDLREEATVLATEDDRLTLYLQRSQIPLSEVASALTRANPRCAEVAARLQTRIDVQWSSLRLTAD